MEIVSKMSDSTLGVPHIKWVRGGKYFINFIVLHIKGEQSPSTSIYLFV